MHMLYNCTSGLWIRIYLILPDPDTGSDQVIANLNDKRWKKSKQLFIIQKSSSLEYLSNKKVKQL